MAYFDFTAGQPLLASQLDSAFDNAGWTAYTPTLTNFTVGNGTFQSAYAQIGKTVVVRFKFTYGSTSTASGTFTASVPVTPKATNTLGDALIDDSSGSIYPAQAYLSSAGTFTMRVFNAAGTYAIWAAASNTVPVVPNAADVYTALLVYEAA